MTSNQEAWSTVASSRRVGAALRVLEHSDGRRIVLGKHAAAQRKRKPVHVGCLLPRGSPELETVAAIYRVAEQLGTPQLGSECVNRLFGGAQ